MKVTLQLKGAFDTVTGSRALVQLGGQTVLIDCGLFQGAKPLRSRNWEPFTPAAQSLSSIVLTHAHLDHSGYLPRLCREGYKGAVHCSEGTAALCQILLRDAAFLEEETANYANERGHSSHEPAMPLFTSDDAELALSCLAPTPRGVWKTLAPGIELRFLRAGHIIGASFVQLALSRPHGQPKLITFSGDVGHNRSFILRGPETAFETDVLVLESTYGDREQPREDPLVALAAVANRTFERGGVLVIPAFAVGRAQELTYMLRLLEDQGRIPKVPVVLDSPMAAAAMSICLRHSEDHILDSAFVGSGEVFRPHKFTITQTPDESMLACMRDGPMVVISASGMLSGGRILHHLKARLPDARNTVLFCGYQAEGSKGRFLQDNAQSAKELRIHHQPVPIEAEIATLSQLSAHADREELLAWLGRLRRLPLLVICNHGEPEAQLALASAIRARFAIDARAAIENPLTEISI